MISRTRMRVAALVVASLLLLALAGTEFLWRLDHPLAQPAVVSPNGFKVAEARFMPEGSSVPYGVGIFLRSRWAVLQSLQSEFAFGGYCGNLSARWPSDQRLVVQCEIREASPRVPAPVVQGTAIEVDVRRKQ
jgi:hypothetical protein